VRTAVVVGAGVGGLAAAGALVRSGWHVTLIERGDRLRGYGAAQFIWPNGVAALHSLGLSLGDVAFPVATGGIRRPDGQWLVPAGTAGPEPVVVHADDLHDTLMAGLGERLEIRTSFEVTTLRLTGERPAVGNAKHTFEADLVVAADGGRSVLRRRLVPDSTVASTGYTAWRAVVPWYRVPARELAERPSAQAVPVGGDMLGAGHRFVHATLGERGGSASATRGGIYWVATVPGAQRPESAAAQLGLLRRWFEGWQSPVPELLEATEPSDLVQQPGEELRPVPRLFGFPVGSGGVVLIGDAAHVAAPALSQGACLALEDAATLGVLLRSTSAPLVSTLDAYTMARRDRVLRVSRASRRLGAVLQAQGRLTVKARDLALGVSSGLLQRASAAATRWSPPA
jgi:2-polyprenyl-6-methoxyphenol hydroxylase-like FAD-dependent oxidoreductase